MEIILKLGIIPPKRAKERVHGVLHDISDLLRAEPEQGSEVLGEADADSAQGSPPHSDPLQALVKEQSETGGD